MNKTHYFLISIMMPPGMKAILENKIIKADSLNFLLPKNCSSVFLLFFGRELAIVEE